MKTHAKFNLGKEADDRPFITTTGLPPQLPSLASRPSRAADEKLRLIEETCSIGHWSVDLSSGQERWSAGLFRIIGLDPRTVAPTHGLLELLVHPGDKDQYQTLARHMRSGGVQSLKFRIVRPDGFCRWVRAHIEPVLGVDGSPTHLLGILSDITEVENWRSASQSDIAALQLVHQITGLVVRQADIDRSGIPAWQVIFGRDASSNENIFDDLGEQAAASLASAWTDARHWRRSVALTCVGRDAGEVLIHGLPLSCEGSAERWIFVSFDLTVARRAVRSLGSRSTLGAPRPSQLRAARGILNWSAQELADRAGLSFSTIRRMEDERAPAAKAETFERLAQILTEAGVRFESSANGELSIFYTPLS